MASGRLDRLRHWWRVMNSDDWRYSPRGLVTNSALSFVAVGAVLGLVFRDAGNALLSASAVAIASLSVNWWRSRHRPPPRPRADAAWYPDPSGRHEHRYWDGDHWTDRVLDGSEQSIDW
jgi:hypothetical protein